MQQRAARRRRASAAKAGTDRRGKACSSDARHVPARDTPGTICNDGQSRQRPQWAGTGLEKGARLDTNGERTPADVSVLSTAARPDLSGAGSMPDPGMLAVERKPSGKIRRDTYLVMNRPSDGSQWPDRTTHAPTPRRRDPGPLKSKTPPPGERRSVLVRFRGRRLRQLTRPRSERPGSKSRRTRKSQP